MRRTRGGTREQLLWKTQIQRLERIPVDGKESNTIKWHTSHLPLCELPKQHFENMQHTRDARVQRSVASTSCQVALLPIIYTSGVLNIYMNEFSY